MLLAMSFQGMYAQSLFDEMIVDGETVSADTVASRSSDMAAEENRRLLSAVQARALRAKRAAMRRAGTDSPLWDLTDADGNPLDPDMFGPQQLKSIPRSMSMTC